MSCHDVGRALDSVAKVIMASYDAGEISKETTRKLLMACRKGVYWCDGNELEAVACVENRYCGSCLKKMKTGEPLYSVWSISFELDGKYHFRDLDGEELVSDRLCTECFDKIVFDKTGDTDLGAKERKRIEEHCSEDEWKAE